MEINITPVRDVLWISLDPKADKTPSGLLFIPPEKREVMTYDNKTRGIKEKVLEPEYRYSDFGKCLVGTVIVAGPGKRNRKGNLIPTELKPGDRVLVPPNCGVEKEWEGKDFLIIREEKVYSKLEEEKAHG